MVCIYCIEDGDFSPLNCKYFQLELALFSQHRTEYNIQTGSESQMVMVIDHSSLVCLDSTRAEHASQTMNSSNAAVFNSTLTAIHVAISF